MSSFDLDTPILTFGEGQWRLRHAVEGVQIFGGIGSGKTSGSGRMLALKYLAAGFGGLVLTVKPDEKEAWQEYCRLAGRTGDLIVIEPGGKYSFNFLEYESTNSGTHQAFTDNIVEVLKTVIRAGEEKDKGKSDDAFWETALDMLIYNVIDLCRLAYGSITVQQLYDVVQSMPKAEPENTAKGGAGSTGNSGSGGNDEKDENGQPSKKKMTAFKTAYDTAKAKVEKMGNKWFVSLSAEERAKLTTEQLYNEAVFQAVPDARLMKFIHDFFFGNFKTLNQKTRSIIEFSFSGFLFRLLRDPVYSLFCRNQSNVVPEDCLEGKVILIDLPVKTYHKIGRDCQVLFKYIWQRSMEKRRVTKHSRPVFLWADEAQNFIHEHDADFQATARSSMIATVYITQNLPNYYGSMGGAKAEYKVKSFLGTLATKIFHANADIETNRYGSDLIGDAVFIDPSRTITIAENFSQADSISLTVDKRVKPEEFSSMVTGGPLNGYKVEGYLHKQGDCIFGKHNFKKVSFSQHFLP